MKRRVSKLNGTFGKIYEWSEANQRWKIELEKPVVVGASAGADGERSHAVLLAHEHAELLRTARLLLLRRRLEIANERPDGARGGVWLRVAADHCAVASSRCAAIRPTCESSVVLAFQSMTHQQLTRSFRRTFASSIFVTSPCAAEFNFQYRRPLGLADSGRTPDPTAEFNFQYRDPLGLADSHACQPLAMHQSMAC